MAITFTSFIAHADPKEKEISVLGINWYVYHGEALTPCGGGTASVFWEPGLDCQSTTPPTSTQTAGLQNSYQVVSTARDLNLKNATDLLGVRTEFSGTNPTLQNKSPAIQSASRNSQQGPNGSSGISPSLGGTNPYASSNGLNPSLNGNRGSGGGSGSSSNGQSSSSGNGLPNGSAFGKNGPGSSNSANGTGQNNGLASDGLSANKNKKSGDSTAGGMNFGGLWGDSNSAGGAGGAGNAAKSLQYGVNPTDASGSDTDRNLAGDANQDGDAYLARSSAQMNLFRMIHMRYQRESIKQRLL